MVAYEVESDGDDAADLTQLTLDQLRKLCKNVGVRYVNNCSKFQCRKALWVLAQYQEQRERDGTSTFPDNTAKNRFRLFPVRNQNTLTETSKPAIHGSLTQYVIPGVSKRSDFPLIPNKCALLIVDIQSYLSQPEKEEELETKSYFFRESLPQTVDNIERLMLQFRRLRDSEYNHGCEVIFTYLEALTKDCRDVSLDYKLSGPQLAMLPNSSTAPATFLSQVSPSKHGRGDICIPKTSCSVFQSTNINYVLRNLGVEQLVITGQLTDQCIESAVRDAADSGFFVTVVDDACASMSMESHARGMMGMRGFCRVLCSDEVLKELSQGYSLQDLQNEIPKESCF